MELGIDQIRAVVPHRYPFLLIDRVIDIKPGESLTALKNVSINEPFFQGHFPEQKVMPGVLIVEALAQAGCVFYHYSRNPNGRPLMYYLARIAAKFFLPVVPGDQLILTIRPLKVMGNTGIFDGTASVQEKKVAAAQLGFSVRDPSSA